MSEQLEGSSSAGVALSARFVGFALPTSNTTYTPNQFFDVCLPHCSRGCLRLISLMIRKTLGWCDRNGRPQQETIRLSYADFEAAGISRGMIKSAVAEAIRRNVVRCVRDARPKSAGQASISALFELNWDESGEYVKKPEHFRGFFAGDGHRTYVPNQFFDHVVVSEPLAVVKVVGAVARSSIGFATKWGHRRTVASLSYSDIQRYTKLADRKSLAAALRTAVRNNYIERVEQGCFDPHGGVQSRNSTYALKWLKQAAEGMIGSKTPPEGTEAEVSVPKPHRDRLENPTGDRLENPTGIQIKQNKTPKQQQGAVPLKEENGTSSATAIEMLIREGFDALTAGKLASEYGIERIIRQIDWIDQRPVRRNRVGMLRVAIAQDWSKPTAQKLGRPNSQTSEPSSLTAARDELAKRFKISSS